MKSMGCISKILEKAQCCYPELVSGSRNILTLYETLNQACPKKMPKQVRPDIFRVQYTQTQKQTLTFGEHGKPYHFTAFFSNLLGVTLPARQSL